MKSGAWKCDGCGVVALVTNHAANTVDDWLELIRHYDDGFAAATDVWHFCGFDCMADIVEDRAIAEKPLATGGVVQGPPLLIREADCS